MYLHATSAGRMSFSSCGTASTSCFPPEEKIKFARRVEDNVVTSQASQGIDVARVDKHPEAHHGLLSISSSIM